jgi:hypothetical protein
LKRRDFITAAALAGAGLPALARAQVRPCPPPTVTVEGGQSISTLCGGDANADWIARSTGPGVQWAQRFTTSTDVATWYVYDPTLPGNPQTNVCRLNPSDGIMGNGCLEFYTPAGQHCNTQWCRPFNPFPGDQGYQSGNPGMPNQPANWNNAWSSWRYGLYGNQDYHDGSANWLGTDFYIQFRYKVSASAFSDPLNPNLGKLAFVDLCGGGDQELVLQSPIWSSPRYWMYTNFGSRNNSDLGSTQGESSPESYQPGGAYAGTCVSGAMTCWSWPAEEWVTVLLHVIPGHNSAVGGGDSAATPISKPANYHDFGIEVWVARAGAKSYTLIWQKLNYVWVYGSQTAPNVAAFNRFTPTAYMNGALAHSDWYRRFDQIIFSKQPVACPQV